jgi:tetratricopeptide (TPR) repeat protein
MEIAQSLATQDPGNAVWQRDLSVSHDRIGDVLVTQGALPEALAAFREGMAIRQKLGAQDPSNAVWQRDLSVSHHKIGDVLVDQGALPEAIAAFRDGIAIRQKLAAQDGGSARWQRDLWVSHTRLAMIHVQLGDYLDAVVALRDVLAVLDRMGNRGMHLDPQVANFQTRLTGLMSAITAAQAGGASPLPFGMASSGRLSTAPPSRTKR